jgi:hypothetical protein
VRVNLIGASLRADGRADDRAEDPLAVDSQVFQRGHVVGDLRVVPAVVVAVEDHGSLGSGVNPQVWFQWRNQDAQLLGPYPGSLALAIALEGVQHQGVPRLGVLWG